MCVRLSSCLMLNDIPLADFIVTPRGGEQSFLWAVPLSVGSSALNFKSIVTLQYGLSIAAVADKRSVLFSKIAPSLWWVLA